MLGPTTSGRTRAATATSATTTHLATTSSRSCATAGGSGGGAAESEPARSSALARPSGRRWTASAMRITARNATVPSACLSTLSFTTQSTTPSPTRWRTRQGATPDGRRQPPRVQAGRDRLPTRRGWPGCRSAARAKIATAALSTPARIHTSWMRRPRRNAEHRCAVAVLRDPAHGDARSVRFRNHVSPTRAIGTTASPKRSSPKKGVAPITCERSDSPVGNDTTSVLAPSRYGMSTCTAVKI